MCPIVRSRPSRFTFVLTMLGALLLVAGCSGSSSSDDDTMASAAAASTTGRTGAIVFTLTDAPTDEFVHVFVTVGGIELLPLGFSERNDSGAIFISGGQQTFDLLMLENVTEPLAIAENVPIWFSGHTATMIATSGAVNGLNGWHLPSGDLGIGFPSAEGRWQEVFVTG